MSTDTTTDEAAQTQAAVAERELAEARAAVEDAQREADAAEQAAAEVEAQLEDPAVDVDESAMGKLQHARSRGRFWTLRKAAAEKRAEKAERIVRRQQVEQLADRCAAEQARVAAEMLKRYDTAVTALRELRELCGEQHALVNAAWREGRAAEADALQAEHVARQLGRPLPDGIRSDRVRVSSEDPFGQPSARPGHGSGVFVDGRELVAVHLGGAVAEAVREAETGHPKDAHSFGPSFRQTVAALAEPPARPGRAGRKHPEQD